MSLFKPSNLTPNFESVIYNQPLTLTFQVNSNGSKVTAYRVQILTDFNGKDDPDKNIIGTIYGTFNTPLYNKDIGEILLTQETLKYNGIELEPNKDYRWTLRLYGEDKRESELVYNIVTTNVGVGNAIEAIDFSKDFIVESSNRNLLSNTFGAISNCDISFINEGIALTSTGNVSTSKLASNFIHFEVGTYTISGQVTQSDGKNGGFSIYNSNGDFIINNSDKGFPSTTFTIKTAGKYYVGLYINYNSDKDVIATFKNLQIEKGSTATEYVPHLNATEYDDYGLIVSQEDITGVLNNLIYSSSSPYVTVTNINEFYKKIKNNNSKNFMILRSEIQNKTQQELNELLKNKIHPKMYFYQINIKKNGAKYEIYINTSSAAFSFKYYRTRYDQIYNENLTYIGSGNLVGSTKQIMWCLGYNDSMKINSYARMVWRPSQYSYFQPFKFNTQTISIKGISNTTIRISADDIKKEYVKNLVNGNFYVLVTNIKNPFDENSSGYNVEEGGSFGNVIDNARKIIDCSFSSSSNEYRLSISANETIPNKSTTPIYLTLLYIQEQKIIQVDKNAGGNGLTKISFEEAFDYNISMNTGENYKEFQYLHLGYVNNNFDYDRFYIDPVEEFDNSTGFSYIILQKSTTSITGDGSAADGSYITQTRLDKLLSSTDQAQVGYKIINYVGKTGEVTIYNKAKNLPTIQTFYYIYKRNNSDNTKYNKITSGWLGGKQYNFSNISTNVQSDENGDNVIFDRLYIQPNIGIKEDDYMPMKLSVYNKDYTKDIYLTNYYNRYWNNGWREINSNHSVINTLDDTMWQIICKNIEGELNSLYISDDNVQQPYALYEPQTQYKIYTNFVDSVPEGFFYSRYDKTIKFEIYDLNTMDSEIEQKVYISKNGKIYLNDEEVNNVPFRDLYIKTICQDSYKDNNGNLVELGINNVPLKEYHYEVMTEDGAVIYSTKETYDGKFHCEFRGCNDNSIYYIKVYIEDNFGKLYTYQTKVPISYKLLTDNTNITITPLCEQQAIKVDFVPIKRIETSGKLVYQEPYIVANSGGDYPTFYEFDEGKNSINIPNNFSYAMQFELNSSMLDRNEELQLLVIETDNHAGYILCIDTRPYLIIDGVYSLNENYMKFRIEGRNTASGVNKIISDYTGYSDFVKPTQFAYAMSTIDYSKLKKKPFDELTDTKKQELEKYKKSIYILPESVDKVATEYQTAFLNTVPASCLDSDNNTLKLYNEDTTVTGDETYIVSNTDQYTISNKQTIENMSVLTFRLTINDTNGTIDNNDVTCSIT